MIKADQLVTVFGGTGFAGHHIVRKLCDAGYHVRSVARNPQAFSISGDNTRLERLSGDIRDEEAVTAAVRGAKSVVNVVSLYVERGDLNFGSIHVLGAGRIARCCRQEGVSSLIHFSGIGADCHSPSSLIRAKARGEQAVSEQFEPATIFRPSVMFGRDDAFVSSIEKATRAPVVPLFGRGTVRQQPAFVKDVARATVNAIAGDKARGQTFELGGGSILTYRQAVELVCEYLSRKRLLVPCPLELWKVLAGAMEILPRPPLTMDQIYLVANDNIVSSGRRHFSDLDIEPRSFHESLDRCFTGNGND